MREDDSQAWGVILEADDARVVRELPQVADPILALAHPALLDKKALDVTKEGSWWDVKLLDQRHPQNAIFKLKPE